MHEPNPLGHSARVYSDNFVNFWLWNQERYYQALEESGSLGESTPFVEFMLEVILVSIKSSEYSSVKTDVKILKYLKKNPHSTIRELAEFLDITSRGVEKQIATLKNEERLKRVGSARKGHWEVLKTP